MDENKEPAKKVMCHQCGMFLANLNHPEKLCIYCVLNITRRDKIFDGDEAPGIGDS